ncbi:MAG: PAS domain S-box protein, partial [Promethearchaeota archaeon]
MIIIPQETYDLKNILFNSIDDILLVLNNDFICEYVKVNAYSKRFKSEIIGKRFIDLIFSEDNKKAEKFLKKILKTRKSVKELRIKVKKEAYIWFEIKGFCFKDISKEKKIILILRDISKYKKREEEFRKRELKFFELIDGLPELQFWKILYPQKCISAVEKTRKMLDNVIDIIPQLIFWKDINHKYLGCNKNFALMCGYNDPNKIIGLTDDDIPWLKKQKESTYKIEQKIIKTGNPKLHLLESWTLSDDKKIYYETNRLPLKSPNGEIMGLITTCEDITKRIDAEKKLKESEEIFRTITEQSFMGVAIIQDDVIKYANKVIEDYISCKIEEILNWPKERFLNFVHPKDKERAIKRFEEIKNGIVGEKFSRIYKIITNSGQTKWFDIYSKIINYRGKNAILLTLVDYTEKHLAQKRLKESEIKLKSLNKELEKKVNERTKELKESEKKLREQNIKLKKIDQLKNDFITFAAHELKTPLSSIQGYTELILTQFKEIDEEMKKHLLRVQVNIKRLNTYIEKIIDVMKID